MRAFTLWLLVQTGLGHSTPQLIAGHNGINVQTIATIPQSDTTFRSGSGTSEIVLTRNSMSNLQLLGQIWGFLKYYHPAVASGKYNWDSELFKFLPEYLRVKSTALRDEFLCEWIDKLGVPPICAGCKPTEAGAKLVPDLNWIQSDQLTPKLRNRLKYIKENRNQGKNYYVSQSAVGNPIFTNEEPYKRHTMDDGYKLLALFRYWNVIQYFYPYKYAIDTNWHDVLAEFIPKVLDAEDGLEFRLTFLELVGKIHDSHAIILADSTLAVHRGIYDTPLQLSFVEDSLIVINYYDSILGVKTGIRPGDIICSVENTLTSKLAASRIKYFPGSNYSARMRDLAADILKGNSREITIKLKTSTGIGVKVVKRLRVDSISYDNRNRNRPYRFVADSIGYIDLGSTSANMIPEIFKRFETTKGLIIDVRRYPKESLFRLLADYLLPHKTAFAKFTTCDLSYPGVFSWNGIASVGKDNPNFYKGKVVILVNEMTQSHAEYTVMSLQTAPDVVVLGSTTAGADGNVSRLLLPGNLLTMISGIGVYYPDGRETQRVGIIPSIIAKPTINGIRSGTDELVEKAVNIIRGSR